MNARPVTAWSAVWQVLAEPATSRDLVKRTGFCRTAVEDALRRLSQHGHVAKDGVTWCRVTDHAPEPRVRRPQRPVSALLIACLDAMGDGWHDAASLVPRFGGYRELVRQRLLRLHALGLVERDGNLWRRK